jgi:hypothetical protein
MISGSEMQQLYNRAEDLIYEIDELKEQRSTATDYDWYDSTERYNIEINDLEMELALIIQEIENYGGEI